MKNQHLPAIAILLIFLASFQTKAQNTFTQVYNILQSNCASSGCHGGISPTIFSVDGSEADVFNALVGVPTYNQKASAKGNELVKLGDPKRSFLLRKISHNLSLELALDSTEGGFMPYDSVQMSMDEFETIRQWIMFGAPMTGDVVDLNVISDYYNGLGMQPIPVPKTPEQEGKKGYQLHIGPFFLKPYEEIEFFKKEVIEFEGKVDGREEELFMNSQSHHFTLYQIPLDQDNSVEEGMIKVDDAFTGTSIHIFGKQLGGWDRSTDISLPDGTAFKWEDKTIFIHNYHVRNYSADSILQADAYVNIYIEDENANNREMFVAFPNFGGFNPFVLAIPPTAGQEHVEEMSYLKAGSNKVWQIWRLRGHTHMLGVDFDAYKRNIDGTKGEQIYEGKSNIDHTFNQGFWDYGHASTRTFEPLLEVNASEGLIFEAKWINNTPDTVRFGLTTDDEMFAGIILYTEADKFTAVQSPDSHGNISIYPNPSNGEIKVTFNNSGNELKTIRIFSVSGMLIYENLHHSGNEFTMMEGVLQSGLYLLEVNGNDSQRTKLVIY